MQPADALILDSALHGQQATIVAQGEMDLSTLRKLHDELVRMVAEGATEFVIDLAQVTFIDSSGIGGLLEARRLGAILALRNPSDRVRRVLDLVLIDSVDGVRVM